MVSEVASQAIQVKLMVLSYVLLIVANVCSFLRGGRGEGERGMRGGEMLLMLAVGWRASAVRGEEAGRFQKVVGVSIVVVGDPCVPNIHINIISQRIAVWVPVSIS